MLILAKKQFLQNSDSFDSLEDEMPLSSKAPLNHEIAHKNKDGFGSYDQWNYVYKNLEQQGYNKDLGEREDVAEDSEEIQRMKELFIRNQERAQEKAFRVIIKFYFFFLDLLRVI